MRRNRSVEQEIHIKEINPINIESGVIINGFPSSGITSAIATESLINTTSLDLGAIIDSEKFPPISIIKNGMPIWKKSFLAKYQKLI